VRGIVCRSLRLQLVAGLSIALAMPALAMAAVNTRLATQTALTVETRDHSGRTQAIVAVTVTGEDGLPASGAVAITDRGNQIAGAALNAKGEANLTLSQSAGGHLLRAVYTGDATHLGSTSQASGEDAQASTTPNFQVSASPATVSLTPGQSGTLTASITPENNSTLSAPMFVTLSCSGLPDQAACTFTPENIEILPTTTSPLTSTMVIVTQEATVAAAHTRSNSVAWAFLLPGALGLGGLAWSARRRPWLQRLTLLALVGLVTMLGATACNARYDYYNHGPPIPAATPPGTYTVTVAAQSSNGVTAITNTTTIALTVQ